MTTHIVMIDGSEYDTQAEWSEYCRDEYMHEDPLAPARGFVYVIALEVLIAVVGVFVWRWLR